MPDNDPRTSTAAAANAKIQAASNVAGTRGPVLTVNIVAEGRTLTMNDVLDALYTKFGATKVRSDNDVVAHGVANLRIIA